MSWCQLKEQGASPGCASASSSTMTPGQGEMKTGPYPEGAQGNQAPNPRREMALGLEQ